MNTYFKVKLFSEYVIPFSISVLIILIALISTIKNVIREYRIEKFFKSHGYERKLLGVPAFGNGAFYGWLRSPDESKQITGHCVDDRELNRLPMKTIKERYK